MGDGGFNIVSTASRVLNQTEQRYTTCEKELLAVVCALQRFRIYIYERKVTLFTDNKALLFLHRCVITSNRVARWMVQIQEYDLEIRHIRGVQRPPLWSSGQSFWLQIQRSRVRFPLRLQS